MWRTPRLLIGVIFGLVFILTGTALAATDDPLSSTPDPQPSSILHPPFSILYSLSSPFHPSSFILHLSAEGAKLYRQWCSTCHGDRGQGLTEAWRAEWPEGKQNCWQSKCHAANHPPDGFSFPKKVPALIGQDTLAKFSTAQDLYVYSQATMPYWAPTLLKDEEYLAITTFLVETNYAARGLPASIYWADDLTAISLHAQAIIDSQVAQKEVLSSSLSKTPYFLLPCLISGCPPSP